MSPETLINLTTFQTSGHLLITVILVISLILGFSGLVNIFSPGERLERTNLYGLVTVNLLFAVGFLLICWLHFRIYRLLPLELSDQLAHWLNRQLEASNSRAAYGMPLYDPSSPPRYVIPLWIESEKYFFWFMCFNAMALAAWHRLSNHRFRGTLLVVLAVQTSILFFFTDPFAEPLPKFFSEISPWFREGLPDMARVGVFMQLYPKMIFYYNAHYMWLHPPMLFLSYACITLTFVTSIFMLVKRQPEIEKLGYDFAKLGYFMLTLGMLLGYPWALQAWGPNWWWDPKICSSIMMWAIYSTYLHTRLYANKPAMWYFSSLLGILCFCAMIFTFLASFFFPGEHTFQ